MVDTLNDLFEKAEGQRDEATTEETRAKNTFDMLTQSQTDEINYVIKVLDETKTFVAENTETMATTAEAGAEALCRKIVFQKIHIVNAWSQAF